jgi:hypothetical protein
LGHPGTSILYKIIKDTQAAVHPRSLKVPCMACSKGKLVIQPAPVNTERSIPRFLEQLCADVCGPTDPPSGPFQMFLAIICASSKWSQVALLSTRNLVFSRILAHILKLKAQFPDNRLMKLQVDNASEFTSHTFDDFCITAGIDVQYQCPTSIFKMA